MVCSPTIQSTSTHDVYKVHQCLVQRIEEWSAKLPSQTRNSTGVPSTSHVDVRLN